MLGNFVKRGVYILICKYLNAHAYVSTDFPIYFNYQFFNSLLILHKPTIWCENNKTFRI